MAKAAAVFSYGDGNSQRLTLAELTAGSGARVSGAGRGGYVVSLRTEDASGSCQAARRAWWWSRRRCPRSLRRQK